MVMMPMAFWASLEPWPKAMKDDERIWSLPKYLLMMPGESWPKRYKISFMKRYPMTMPKTGEMRSEVRIFTMPPTFRMRRAAVGHGRSCDARRTSACEELTGSPMRIVMMFQRMAESRAEMMTTSVTAMGSTMPDADGLCHGRREEGAEDVHACGEDHRRHGREDLGRHHGGDGVRAVVPAVRDIEKHREDDDEDQDFMHVSGRCFRECWRCLRPGPRRLQRAGRCLSI